MKKITTVLLALLISLCTIGCFGGNQVNYLEEECISKKNPGKYVEIEPNPLFIKELTENLVGPQFGEIKNSNLRFYKDYNRAYEYFYNEIETASYKNGKNNAIDFASSFPDLPEMKEYLGEYGVMSMDLYVELFVNNKSNNITYTVLYLVDRTTQKVSYWTISNDF